MGAAPSSSRRPEQEAVEALPKLHQAVRDGNVNEIMACISGGGQINSRDRIGRTPLMMAAITKGDAGKEALATVLAHEPDASSQDRGGMTALMHSAAEPSVDSITALAGASGIEVAEATDCNGATVVHHLAASKAAGRVAALRALFAALQAAPAAVPEEPARDMVEGEDGGAAPASGSAGGSGSADAARLEDPRLLALLNAQDWDGHTALHAAAHRGDASMVAALLEFGADRTLMSRDQKLASELAFSAEHAEVGLALTVAD